MGNLRYIIAMIVISITLASGVKAASVVSTGTFTAYTSSAKQRFNNYSTHVAETYTSSGMLSSHNTATSSHSGHFVNTGNPHSTTASQVGAPTLAAFSNTSGHKNRRDNPHAVTAAQISGLATVATSGLYSDLSGQPSIPSAATDISYSNLTYPTVAAALDQLLYVTPSILTFTNRITYGTVSPYTGSTSSASSSNTIEIGNTISRVELFWTLNKTVTTQSIDNSIGSIDSALRAYDHTGQSITAGRTYILTVGDGTNTDTTPYTYIYQQHKRYWGVSSNTTLTDAQIIALSSEFGTARAKGSVSSPISFSPAAQYIYYAYPASWLGATTNMYVNGLQMTDWQLTSRTFVNASGNSTTFYIWRTTNLLNGTYTWYMN